MVKVVKELKIKWDEDTLTEIYSLPYIDDMLGRYTRTGTPRIVIPCRFCSVFTNTCVCHDSIGVEGDTIQLLDNGKYRIKEGPKHLQKWLKAVGAK